MKKIVICSLFFLLSHSLWATHIRGGHLEYKWISDNTYEFTAVVFLDVAGVLAEPEVSISGLPDLVSLPFFEYAPLPGEAGKYTRKGIYKKIYTFPAIPFLGVVTYKIGLKIQNRNVGIINLGPRSELIPFYAEVEIQISNYLGANNSPQFKDNLPLITAKTHEISITEVMATDTDGDSLVYSLTPTLQSKEDVATGYVQPDKVLPCTSCTLTLESTTGIITWDKPMRAGEYVITLKVEEFRRMPNTSSYVRIGYITRDIQVIVQD